jgi:hypothetical protein
VTQKVGTYIFILLYLQECEDAVASFKCLPQLVACTRRKMENIRQFIIDSDLFYLDLEQGLFQSKYLCEVMSIKQRIGQPSESNIDDASMTHQSNINDTSMTHQCAITDANLSYRGREDIDIDKDIDKDKEEEKKASAPASALGDLNLDREPECVAQIFGNAGLLRAIEQRVDYAVWSNRVVTGLARRWFSERLRRRGYFGSHPMTHDEAVAYLCRLLRPGSKSRQEFWEFSNREQARASP